MAISLELVRESRIVRSTLLFVVLSIACFGQTNGTTAAAEKDPFDRETPRSTVLAFLDACASGNYARAAEYLDVRARPLRAPEQTARQLEEVLNQQARLDPTRLSPLPSGDLRDGLAEEQERIGTVRLQDRSLDLRLERRDGIWLFSTQTVALIPVLAEALGESWIESRLPSVLVTTRFIGLALWQWAGLALIILLAWALARMFGRLLLRIARWVLKLFGVTLDEDPGLLPPFRLLFSTLLLRGFLRLLVLPLLPRSYVLYAITVVNIIAAAWLLWVIADVVFKRIAHVMTSQNRPHVNSVLPLARRVFKAFVFASAVIGILASFGYDTGALLAGLGIGGLAIAFAAQRTLENLFGGLTLVADSPVTVGDLCKVGDKMAVVEDIGLRSTRLRTTERTLLVVPNGQFSSGIIENYTSRDKLLMTHNIRIHRSATPDQLRFVLKRVRQLLLSHPLVDPNPARIRLLRIEDTGFVCELWTYIATKDWDLFMKTQEEILLNIMDLVQEAGTSLAVPMQEQLGAAPVDEEHANRIAEQVSKFRQEGKLNDYQFGEGKQDGKQG